MPNVILDTNIFIRALIGSRIASNILDKALLEKKLNLIASDILLKEIIRIAQKPRIAVLIPRYKLVELISLLRERAVFVEITENLTACRDIKDNFLLEMALKTRAAYLITNDNDLLILNPFQNTEIVRPENFLRRLI